MLAAEIAVRLEPLQILRGVVDAHPGLWGVVCPLWMLTIAVQAARWRPRSALGQRLLARRPHPSGWVVVLLFWALGSAANVIGFFERAAAAGGGTATLAPKAWEALLAEALSLATLALVVAGALALQKALWGFRGVALQALTVAATLVVTLTLLVTLVAVAFVPLA